MDDTGQAIHPTNAFKAHIAEHIRAVVADPRARVRVGARRIPQAVLMSVAADVPASIRRILLRGSALASAQQACRSGRFASLDRDAGTVFAWLWQHDEHEAMQYLAEIAWAVAEIDEHATADEIIAAVAVAAADMPRAEIDRIAARSRENLSQAGRSTAAPTFPT